ADLRHVKHIRRSLLLVAAVVALTAAPASAAGGTDVDAPVRSIAERAATVTVEERTLLELATNATLDSTARSEIEARIRTVDARGVELLDQLDRLHVELTQAIRTSLGPLASVEDRMVRPDAFVPAAA